MTSLAAGRVAHVDPASTQVLNHLDFLCRVLVDGDVTGGSFGLIEERGRRGCMSPRHVHAREAETFIVLDGALEGWCAGNTQLVEAGSVLHLPAQQEHAFRVASDRAHFYVLVTPAGFEKFFPATGEVVHQPFDGELPIPGPLAPDMIASLVAVLTPLDCTITGPPPFDASS